MSAPPTLTPRSQTSAVILPPTGNADNVAAALPFNVYGDPSGACYSTAFLTGAADQVAYTYKKLGGEVLDIELTACQVYACYEEAVLEWSTLMNIHQAKNSLSNFLGSPTGSFDEDGKITNELSASHVNLKFPKFDFAYSRRVADGIASEVGIGGTNTIYSASVNIVKGVQDYDLQAAISSSAATDSSLEFFGKVTNKKILINKVYWKSPMAMWRFYGYYGGLNVVGNLSHYGQYADDSTFEVVPVWQNRLQAQAFEEAIYVRNSHFSFELKNNKLRIHPIPQVIGTTGVFPNKLWFEFSIPGSAYESDTPGVDIGLEGVNNLGTLPFDPIPYQYINQIGKHWIRRYALACSKEVLGQIRGKFTTIPIPGESVTLNWQDLLAQAAKEKEDLREELKTVLDELTYPKLIASDAELVEGTTKIQEKIPNLIYTG